MTVYFISAGPGAPDLITLRAKTLIEQCQVILYAGSLIPDAVLEHASANSEKISTAPLSRPEIFSHFENAHAKGQDVARLHSGDISLYSAIAEQISFLKNHNINYELVPGVPAFAAAASSFGIELTMPGLCQSVILTRTAKNSSPLPATESLSTFAQSKATLAIHLSAKNAHQIVEELKPHYGADCPVLIAVEVSWPSEKLIRTCLENLPQVMEENNIERTAIIFVGRALDAELKIESALYDETYARHLKEK